jgi:hypothetical protein
MKSKYTSGKSVGKNQTVPIGVDDPRLKPGKIGQTKARQGAEIDIVGLDGKSLISGGRNLNNPAARVPPAPLPPDFSSVVIPPIGNKPPKTYPGGSGPVIITPTDPTSVSAVWSGNDLVITFNWDYANDVNDTVSQFIVELTTEGVTRRTPSNTFKPNTTQTAQTITVTKSMITTMFNVFKTDFSAICVLSSDPLNNISNTVCAATLPTYVLDLPVPVINVTSITSGYSVSYTTPTQDVFDGIEVVEYESTSSTEPTGVIYKRTFFDTLNPAVVITPNFNKRWVKARFSSDAGIYTAYSAAQSVTPTVIGSVDTTPPNEVVSASAVWSGDNIVVSYVLPSTDPAARVEIELTAPNTLVGYFYRFPVGSGTNQTATITRRDLLEQFGEHYSSFTGILKSIDSNDNRSDGVSFNVPVRTNPLNGVVPTFSLTPLTNGYSVFANNYESTPGVSYMKVYAKHTAWSGDPLNDDDLVYGGSNPAVIIDTVYTPVYIKIIYYDDFNNTSSYSNQSNNSTTPLDAGIVTSFENPITFGANGVIYAGENYNSGNRTLFKTGGIFAYDATNTSPSTQIISNAAAGTPTFITRQAQIADWNITSTKIENDLDGPPTAYTGLSATGPYSFWAGSAVSGGNETSKFTVTPAGEVTAREITILGNGSPSTNLISAGGLFTVKNDGTVTATSADIQGVLKADSGEFLGNVLIKSGGSLYSPQTSGTVPEPGVAGVIFNSEAISAFNADGGYTQMYVTPLTDSTKSTFKTTAADIAGWKVSADEIKKTSLSGGGTITLNSTGGYISVSNGSVGSYTAGINGAATLSLGSNVFWAGSGGASSANNGFRVTLDGKMYATGAAITGGTVTSANGAADIVTLDGVNNLISMQTSLSSTYLFPRNSNTYLTSGNPFPNSGTGDYANMNNLNNNPYFAAGSAFKDYWGTDSKKGIGIFTGAWDYFAGGSSTPFITATTTGLQLSASPTLGLLLDAGTSATGDKLNPAIASGTPSMLFYTAKKASAPYSPTTEYGAWAAFTNNKIKLTAAETVFINVDGTTGSQNIEIASTSNIWQKFTSSAIRTQISSSIAQEFNSSGIKTQATADIWQQFTSSGIRLQSTDSVYQTFDGTSITLASGATSNTPSEISAYGGASKIVISSSKVSITGIPRAATFDMADYRSNPYYRGASPLGYPPRQRMVIEDPVSGEAQLGMAVYYLDLTKVNVTLTSGPSDTMGVQGDLAVMF